MRVIEITRGEDGRAIIKVEEASGPLRAIVCYIKYAAKAAKRKSEGEEVVRWLTFPDMIIVGTLMANQLDIWLEEFGVGYRNKT